MAKKKPILRIENLRRLFQISFFLLFLWLFLATVGKIDLTINAWTVKSSIPVDIFFRTDPLLFLSTSIALRQIITSMLWFVIPIVLLTVIAGRFFCGWICPMGTLLDACDTLFWRKRDNKKQTSKLSGIKYILLAAIIGSSAFAAQTAYLFDPFAILYRAFTFTFYPIIQLGKEIPFVGEWMTTAIPGSLQNFFSLNMAAFIILLSIILLGSIVRRFWCRNLCPLGALLGLLSRFGIVRRKVKQTCTNCSKCMPYCKMNAIEEDPKSYKATECIYCYSCVYVCPTLVTSIAPSFSSEGYNPEINITRRRLIAGIGLGAVFALIGKTNIAAKTSRNGHTKTSSSFLIRPPGAVAEDEFVDKCLRCSECMKVCPTGGLQPAITEAGIEGLWTPILVPRIGECTQNCNSCAKVCPSEAIKKFEVPEKRHIYLGTAVIDRSKCIVWNAEKKCMVCDEYCSYDAIYGNEVDGVIRPFVNTNKCVGCGICESACPIQPQAAIRVHSFGDKRHLTREEQKELYNQNKE